MIIKTKVFDLAATRFVNLSALAKSMGISVSQVYRVREGKRGINDSSLAPSGPSRTSPSTTSSTSGRRPCRHAV